MKLRGNRLLRGADASLGRLLVFFLGLIRLRRSFPKIESIGVLRLSAIGDLILLSGVIQDLRHQHPQAKIILFCGRDNCLVAPLIPGVDQVECLDLSSPLRCIRALRHHRLSLLLDFAQWSRIDALFSYFSGARYTVGFRTPGQQRHSLYNLTIDHSPDCHEIDNFRHLAQLSGSMTLPVLQLKAEPLPVDIRAFCSQPLILLHPWAAGRNAEERQWPKERWVALAHQLIEAGYRVAVTGGPADLACSQALIEAIGPCDELKSFAGRLSLNQLGHVIQAASAVVSVNTGTMHFAACFSTPLVGLSGPTSDKRWGPLGTHALSLSSTCAGCPYLHLGWEQPQNPPACMEGISVDQVLDALASKIVLYNSR